MKLSSSSAVAIAKPLRRLVSLAALIAVSFGIAQPAAAQSLIKTPDARALSRAPVVVDSDRRVTSYRVVEIDHSILETHVAPRHADGEDLAAASRNLDGLVELGLAPGFAALFQRSQVAMAGDGALEWDGTMVGGRPGTATLRIRDGRVFGQIQFGGRTFRIEPLVDSLHVLKEYDTESLPGDIVLPVPRQRGAVAQPPVAQSSAGPAFIDLLVAYTAKAHKASSVGIGNEIRLAVQLANTAFINSGVPIRYKLLRIMIAKSATGTNYNEDAVSYEQNLYDMTSGAVLAGIRTQRDAVGADLVALIREGGSYCGIGWMPTPPSAGTSGYGFAVVTRSCITNHTFAHELGHNTGLNHDRYVVSSPPAGSFNYGYVNTVDRVRSIMAYNNKCSDLGFSCTRVPFFSTPAKLYNGVSIIGLARNNPQAAFSVYQLRLNRAAVAAYRNRPVADLD